MPSPPPTAPDPKGDRIAKLLARAGIASRREVERMIAEGRVALNGVALTTPATVLASLDGVTVDDEPVAAAEAARLFLYHKPAGLLVTERDPGGRPTIYDRLPRDLPRLVPVGRLDLNTEGLLLMTSDGGLKRLLELPATGVERTYRARAYGQVSQAQLEDLIEGVEVEGVRYGRIDANLERRTGANVWIELTLTEGKNREVRRVLEHLGLKVGRLIRTRYGPFVLGDLPPGAVGEVRAHDVESFRANPTRLDLPQPARRREPEMAAPIHSSPFTGRGTASRQAGGGGAAPQAAPAPRVPGRPGRPNTAAPLRQPQRDRPERGGAAQPDRQARPARFERDRAAAPTRQPQRDRPERDPAAPPGRQAQPARSRRDRAATSTQPAKPARAARAAAHRQATGRADDAPERGVRPDKPVRKPGWARAKPKPGPGKPRKPRGPRA